MTDAEPGEERGAGTACAPDVTVRPAAEVHSAFDAVVLAGGATLPRDLPVPGPRPSTASTWRSST